MKSFSNLVDEVVPAINEIMPWDLEEKLNNNSNPPLLIDIREPYEFEAMHIAGALNVPRGILETACEYDYEETEPELVQARSKQVIVICRSGNRSALATYVMLLLGYQNVSSLKTGLRGWNDFEQPLVDQAGQPIRIKDADEYFKPKLRPEQLAKKYNSLIIK